MGLLKNHIQYQDMSTMSKCALFNLSQLSPNMYFVIKLEKVLQGDINDALDTYIKPPSNEDAKMDKLKAQATSNCDRLGKYRMPFAWTAIPLVDVLYSVQRLGTICTLDPDGGEIGSCSSTDNMQTRNNSSSLDSLKRIANECSTITNFVRKGSLERNCTLQSNISNFSSASYNSSGSNGDKRLSVTSEDMQQAFTTFTPVTITNKLFYRPESDKFSDDDLYKLLQELKKNSTTLKRIRSIHGLLKIDISSVTEERSVRCRVNPELVRLHPYADLRPPVAPVKELLEFRDLQIPHFEHRNLLYIYPKNLNFTNVSYFGT